MEIFRITQINKKLQDNNDHYCIELKISETKQKFTIMPNNSQLYKTGNLRPIKERYQDVNKNEIQFLGKECMDVEHGGKRIKLPLLITKGNNITPLLGVNWSKQLRITINKSYWTKKPTNQKQFTKIQSTLRDQPYNTQCPSKITNKNRMLPNTTKTTTNTLSLTRRREKRTRPTYQIRTPRKTRNHRRRLLSIPRSTYG